jgi:glycine cleavage system H protein
MPVTSRSTQSVIGRRPPNSSRQPATCARGDPPKVGDEVTKDQPYAQTESVKAVSDLFAPLSGEIVQVNDALGSAPETINEDPYGQGWLVKVKLSDPSEADSLMSAGEYKATLRP